MREPEEAKGYWKKYLSRLELFIAVLIVALFFGIFIAQGFASIIANLSTSLSLTQAYFVATFAVSFAGLVERWVYDSKKKECLLEAKIDKKTIQEIHEIWDYINKKKGKYQK